MRTPCQENPELWVSLIAADRAKAARQCAPCHRIETCLQDALRSGERENVYGGVDLGRHTSRRRWPTNAPTKGCTRCGQSMSPRSNESRQDWDARLFCSKTCANRDSAERRRVA